MTAPPSQWPNPQGKQYHRFSDPKHQKCKNPNPYNLSNNPNKVGSLNFVGFCKTLTVITDEKYRWGKQFDTD